MPGSGEVAHETAVESPKTSSEFTAGGRPRLDSLQGLGLALGTPGGARTREVQWVSSSGRAAWEGLVSSA